MSLYGAVIGAVLASRSLDSEPLKRVAVIEASDGSFRSPGDAELAGPRHRAVRGVSTATLAGSAAIAVAIVAGYLAYVTRYASNGVFRDEWNWVDLMSKSYAGSVTLSDLWRQHNENRLFFPNLILISLGRATGLSEIAFIYLGAALLIAAVFVLIIACRSDVLRHPLPYLPALLIFFSLAQYENSLWGIQFGIFLVVACIAGAVTVLSAPRIGVWRFLAAVAFGIIASYSFIQGFTIWAAGLVALLRPGISRNLRIAWCAAGAAVAAFYVYGLDLNTAGATPLSELIRQTPNLIYSFFVAVGSVVPGLTLVGSHYEPDFSVTATFGVIIVVAACLVLVSWALHGRSDRVLTVAAALVVAGLLFDLMLMPNGPSAGIVSSTVSRYTTFNLLLLGGIYLGGIRTLVIAIDSGPARWIGMSGAFAGVIVALVCVQVPVSARAGVDGGITLRAYHDEAANLTANYRTAPESLVLIYGYPPSYTYFKTQAAFLEANHLNVFGDGESAAYQRSGILAGGVVSSPLPVPGEFGPVQSDADLWRAWLALSSVYEQRPDLQKAFPGPTLQGSRQMVAWALQSGMDPADPPDSGVLQPYANQYKLWLAADTTLLPVPPEVGPIQSDAANWQAWLALSYVYGQRPDLRKAYAGLTLQTSRDMVAWAVRSGASKSPVLQPFAGRYRVWLAAKATPLPIPPEFGAIQSDAAKWQAWLALSLVYEQRADLQKAFRGPTVLSSRQMVAWALGSGLDPADPMDFAMLQPYTNLYKAWLAAATR